MSSSSRPARRKKAKPANWTPNGWPRPEYRLPDLDVLEKLSREGPIDADQADLGPTDGQLERLETDLDDLGPEQMELGLGETNNSDVVSSGPGGGREAGLSIGPLRLPPAVD